MFESLNTKKSISDQVIYRPVKYKILFGDLASGELQAKFNVTKTPNTSFSDTEIKQRVINLIDTYSILIIGTLVKIFTLQKWRHLYTIT